MNAQKALFDQGMRPVVRSLPSKPQWKRLVEYAHYTGGKAGKDFAIHFSHKISSPPGETLYFAFCPPHSYGDCLARLGWLDSLFDQPTAEVAYGRAAAAAERAAASSDLALGLRAREAAGLAGRPGAEHLLAAQRAALEASADLGLRASHGWRMHTELASASAESACEVLPSRRPGGVYYRRELLTYSVEGRRIDLITISGHTGIKGTEPPLPAPLLPQSGASPARRPSRFPRKRTIFITSRVHPGETPCVYAALDLWVFSQTLLPARSARVPFAKPEAAGSTPPSAVPPLCLTDCSPSCCASPTRARSGCARISSSRSSRCSTPTASSRASSEPTRSFI